MLAHVSSQTSCLSIGIATQFANKLLGGRVQKLMMIESLLAGECCTAHLADMRPFRRMHGHVLPQSGMGGEMLVAYLAAKWSLAGVTPQMNT